jgi:hypothetical protein
LATATEEELSAPTARRSFGRSLSDGGPCSLVEADELELPAQLGIGIADSRRSSGCPDLSKRACEDADGHRVNETYSTQIDDHVKARSALFGKEPP